MNQKLLIGTYSETGIYELEFDGNYLKQTNSNTNFENCSFLCKNNNLIYSAVEYSNNADYSNGLLLTRNSDLKVINSSTVLGKSPCHITLDTSKKLLYISNYEDGSLNIFSLNSDNTINDLIYHKTYTPKSHIHYTAVSNNVLFVVDLGDNKLFAYEIINNDSNFDLKELAFYSFPENSGPRHLVLNQNNIYIVTENSCELYHLMFSQENQFVFMNKISILPSNTIKAENDTGCAIKLSNDSNFIYTSIRGNNSISVFDTSLNLIQNISCFGNTPRDISFDATQNFMFCANQNSSNISIFKRDKKTGHLLFQSKYPINSPACIIL